MSSYDLLARHASIVLCALNCMQVMQKFIPLYVRQYDSATILIVYLPISEDWTILDILKHAVRNLAQGAIEGAINEYFLNFLRTKSHQNTLQIAPMTKFSRNHDPKPT